MRVPAAIGEAVGGDVATVFVDVLRREEAADAGREQPDEPDLGPLPRNTGVGVGVALGVALGVSLGVALVERA